MSHITCASNIQHGHCNSSLSYYNSVTDRNEWLHLEHTHTALLVLHNPGGDGGEPQEEYQPLSHGRWWTINALIYKTAMLTIYNILLLFVCLDAKCIIFLNVVQRIILLCLQNESVDRSARDEKCRGLL